MNDYYFFVKKKVEKKTKGKTATLTIECLNQLKYVLERTVEIMILNG